MKKNIIKDDMSFCTGCKMCADLCPTHAISFQLNREGFYYPLVDDSKCNKCGKCVDRCPAIDNSSPIVAMDDECDVYAAASIDSAIRDMSTSGGMFFEMSRQIISEGGVVYGCRYSDDYKSAFHTSADCPEELEHLVGTKYFQSDTEKVYSRVKKTLESQRKVMFAGTPCQNAALKHYLNKEYENLIQMDFVCNSITSPWAYKKWLEELENKYNSEVIKVRAKDKKEGWSNLNTIVYFRNGSIHREDRYSSLWGKGLIQYNLYQRKSCYHCPFRGVRGGESDITVGDFWGLDNIDSYDDAKGISLVILHTDKARRLFQAIKKNLYFRKSNIETVIKGNRRLITDPVYSEKREEFFCALAHHPFSESVYLATGEKEDENQRIIDIEKLRILYETGDIDIEQYIFLNYLSPNVCRKGRAEIIPHKYTVFEFDGEAHVVLYGNRDFHVGLNKPKGASMETYIRVEKGGLLELFHGGELYCDSRLEVKQNAVFSAGFFGLNSGCVVIAQRRIEFGEEVMCGRNTIVLDSDFHQMQTGKGIAFNPPQTVIIGDHTWLTGDVRVVPGARIGCNSIIGHYSVIDCSIPMQSYVTNAGGLNIRKYTGRWSWRSNRVIYKGVNSKGDKRQILVGFGKEGKEYYEMQKDFIDFIIDNYSPSELVQTMAEFQEKHNELDDNYVFVIGSHMYKEELEALIRDKYPDVRIYMHDEIAF